ncbi:hypothetical protein NMG60_11018439 [Bertholletia excelsa]
MADAGEFWLPSDFLTDDDILVDKDYFKENRLSTAIPAYFGSYGSPVESVVGSTETESDEEDCVVRLTRRLERSALDDRNHKIVLASQNLEKPRILSGSPQSTLSAIGSWSGNGSPNGPSQVPSPTAASLVGDGDAWNLIYAAAGQVARLKMNNEGPPRNRGFLGPPQIRLPSPPAKASVIGFFPGQCPPRNLSHSNHFENARGAQLLNPPCSSIWGRPTSESLFTQHSQIQQQLISLNGGEVSMGFPQSAWPPAIQVPSRNRPTPPLQYGSSGTSAVFHGGATEKRKCAGTGVFLPRRYNPSENRVKSGSAAISPARVVQAPNKNCGMPVRARSPALPRFSGPVVPEYDIMAAQRNMVAVVASQQRRSMLPEGMANHELRLPQDWTY